MKFAIIKEQKSPPDRRVVLPQSRAKAFLKITPAQLVVESSQIRAFLHEYSVGIKVTNDISDADVMIGVKEVPIEALIPNKSYFYFSHTIKKQP